MADLVTRLLLNSTQFDNNITKSTQQVQRFQQKGATISKSINRSFSSMLGAATKLAGGLGVAMGSYEALSKTIASSQRLTDEWGRTTEAATSITDSFFNAIAQADFGSFLSGISEAISKAKEYYNIIDDLATFNIFHNSTIAAEQLKITEAKRVINSKASSKADVAKAAETIKQSEAAIIAENNKLGEKAGNAYYAAVRKVLANNGGVKASNKVIDTYFSYDGLEKAKKDLEILRKKHSINDYNGVERFTGWGKDQATAKGLQAIIELSDEATREIMKYKEQAIAAKQATANIQYSNVKSLNKAEKGTTGGSGSTGSKELTPEESIRYYEQELQVANKEFNSAVSDSARAAIQAKIDELKEVIRVMNFKAQHQSLPTMDNKNGNMSSSTSLKQSADPTKGLKVQGLVPAYTNKDVKTNNDYADSLNGIAQIMGNIQGATDGAAASWLNYASNIASGVAGMITAITALSAANAAEQQTASGAAGAEAVKSAAQTPIVGWLMVGAAAASVIAALASLPKFATGGIIQGNSTFGDMNLARVNAGEMILNTSQQGRLFSMLNNGDTPVSQGNDLEFKLRGDIIYGVLKNYTNKIGKLR